MKKNLQQGPFSFLYAERYTIRSETIVATESPLKIMKCFFFILKACFVFKIFKFWS